MKEKKTEFRWFTIVEYEKEQEYLRKMHQKGWKFFRVTFPGFYHFEKCERAKSDKCMLLKSLNRM